MVLSTSPYGGSPLSTYSMDSPTFSQELSDDEQFAYSAEYEARWGQSSWGQWPADLVIPSGSSKTQTHLPWQRSGSIVSICSDDGAEERKRMTRSALTSRKPSSEIRRGSDTSLLAYALTRGRVSSLGSSCSKIHRIAAEQRRRSSNMSRGSNASTVYTDPEEAAQVRRLRTIDQLSRRFSEVVGVEDNGESSSSDGEEVMHWFPSNRVPSAWSPDTASDGSEDESEVQSLPSLPTPDVRPASPAIFSNFPLPTTAVQDVVASSPQTAALAELGPRGVRMLDTPPPPIAPSHLLRKRQAQSYLRSESAPVTADNKSTSMMERPRPMFARSGSSPLFSATAYVDHRRGKRLSQSKLKAVDTAASPASSDTLTTGASLDILAIDLSQLRKQSIAEDVTDFGFLASEITVESEPVAAASSPKKAFKRPTSLPLHIFKAHAHPLLSMPPTPASSITPRFNPMDSFLGKDGQTPAAARPHHPESFFPPVSPTAHSKSASSRGSPQSSRSASTPRLQNAPRVRPVSLQALVRAVGSASDGLNIANAPGLHGRDGSRLIAEVPAPLVYIPRLSPESSYASLPPMVRTSTDPIVRVRTARKAVPVFDASELPELCLEIGRPQVVLAPVRPVHRRQQSNDTRSSHEHPAGRKCRRCEEKRLIREHKRGTSDPHPRPTRPVSAQYTFPAAAPQRPRLVARKSYIGAPVHSAPASPPHTLDSPPKFAHRFHPRSKHLSIISGPVLVGSSREMPASIAAGPHAVHPDDQRRRPAPILRRTASAMTLSQREPERSASPSSRLSGSNWITSLRSASRGAPVSVDSHSSGSDQTLVGTPPQHLGMLSEDDKAYLQQRVHRVRL